MKVKTLIIESRTTTILRREAGVGVIKMKATQATEQVRKDV